MNVLERTVGSRSRKTRRGGFTLIELVMVLVILVIVAGISLPIVDWVRRSANYGAASSNQASLLNNLQLYRTTFGNGKYPNRFDSLFAADGTVYDALQGDLKNMIDTANTGISSEALKTLTKSGISQVMDHSTDTSLMVQGSLQNSGIVPRDLAVAGPVAFVKPVAVAFAGTTGGDKAARELYRGLYPDSDGDGLPEVPDGVRIALFAVGPGNDAVGRTLQTPPLFTEADVTTTYSRFVVAVATFDPRAGRRAQVKAILDPKGRLVNRQISEFWQSVAPDAAQ